MWPRDSGNIRSPKTSRYLNIGIGEEDFEMPATPVIAVIPVSSNLEITYVREAKGNPRRAARGSILSGSPSWEAGQTKVVPGLGRGWRGGG